MSGPALMNPNRPIAPIPAPNGTEIECLIIPLLLELQPLQARIFSTQIIIHTARVRRHATSLPRSCTNSNVDAVPLKSASILQSNLRLLTPRIPWLYNYSMWRTAILALALNLAYFECHNIQHRLHILRECQIIMSRFWVRARMMQQEFNVCLFKSLRRLLCDGL